MKTFVLAACAVLVASMSLLAGAADQSTPSIKQVMVKLHKGAAETFDSRGGSKDLLHTSESSFLNNRPPPLGNAGAVFVRNQTEGSESRFFPLATRRMTASRAAQVGRLSQGPIGQPGQARHPSGEARFGTCPPPPVRFPGSFQVTHRTYGRRTSHA